MVATIAQSERDLSRIVFTVRELAELLARQPPLLIGGYVKNVDLNSANTDNTIIIAPLFTNYYIDSVLVRNRGTTGNLTLATAGLFTSTGGGGVTLAANQSLAIIASATVDVAQNMTFLTLNQSAWIDYTRIYFRVGTAQGAAATCDVYVYIRPLP